MSIVSYEATTNTIDTMIDRSRYKMNRLRVVRSNLLAP